MPLVYTIRHKYVSNPTFSHKGLNKAVSLSTKKTWRKTNPNASARIPISTTLDYWDLMKTIVNFYSFVKYMVDDMDKDIQTVISVLLQVVNILNSQKGTGGLSNIFENIQRSFTVC
jgi:hypothetical protein